MTLDKRPFEGKGKNGKIVSKPLDGEWWKTPFNKCVSRYLNTKKKIEEGTDDDMIRTSVHQMCNYQIESLEWLKRNYKFEGFEKHFRLPIRPLVSSIITLGIAQIDRELGKKIMSIDKSVTILSNSRFEDVRREVLMEKTMFFDASSKKTELLLFGWSYEDFGKYSDALRLKIGLLYAIAYDFGLKYVDPSEIPDNYVYSSADRIEHFKDYVEKLNLRRALQVKSLQESNVEEVKKDIEKDSKWHKKCGKIY